MDIKECIKGRRSIRKFKDEKVPHELIEEIVGLATYAPSWKNSQTTRYIVIEDRKVISKIANDCVLGFKYNTKTMENSPALVVLTTVTGRCGYEKDGTPTTPKEDRSENFDAGIAAQTFCLAAYEKGLGTVIMGIFDDDKVAEAAGVPEGQRVNALISIGWPDIAPDAPSRKTSDELLSFK